jgi:hypothetical protein
MSAYMGKVVGRDNAEGQYDPGSGESCEVTREDGMGKVENTCR